MYKAVIGVKLEGCRYIEHFEEEFPIADKSQQEQQRGHVKHTGLTIRTINCPPGLLGLARMLCYCYGPANCPPLIVLAQDVAMVKFYALTKPYRTATF